jgi:hypothetical protein
MLRASVTSDGAVTLRWAGEALAYRIYSDMGTGYGVYIYQATVSSTHYRQDALRPGALYRYRVVAYRDGVESVPAHVAIVIQGQAASGWPAPRRVAPAQELAVTPAPTTVPPNTIILGVLSSEQYVDDLGTLTVAGEVRNDSALNISGARVAVTFYDALGQALGEAETPTLIDILSPGQRSPFILTLPRPATLADYSLRATACPTTEEPRSHLAVLSSRSLEEGGFYHVVGQVENQGPSALDGVKVMVTLYDLGGKVVNVGVTRSKPEHLAPGEQATFDCVFTYFPWVSTHSVQADGE